MLPENSENLTVTGDKSYLWMLCELKKEEPKENCCHHVCLYFIAVCCELMDIHFISLKGLKCCGDN